MMFYEFTSRLDEIAAKHLMITEEIPTFHEYKTWIEPVYQEYPIFDDVHGKDQAAMLYAAFGIEIFKEIFYELHPCETDLNPALEVNHGDLL